MSALGVKIKMSSQYVVVGRREQKSEKVNEWGFLDTISECREWSFCNLQEAKKWANKLRDCKFSAFIMDMKIGMKVYQN